MFRGVQDVLDFLSTLGCQSFFPPIIEVPDYGKNQHCDYSDDARPKRLFVLCHLVG